MLLKAKALRLPHRQLPKVHMLCVPVAMAQEGCTLHVIGVEVADSREDRLLPNSKILLVRSNCPCVTKRLKESSL
jgi:hypothetical protein